MGGMTGNYYGKRFATVVVFDDGGVAEATFWTARAASAHLPILCADRGWEYAEVWKTDINGKPDCIIQRNVRGAG